MKMGEYMKKKNAFTLIELLGVIVLIGIVALITVPTMDGVIKRSRQNAYDATKDSLITSLKDWLVDNKGILDDGETITLSLADLKEQGYVNFDIKNPSSGNCLDNLMEFIITRDGKKYTYIIVDDELIDGDDTNCEALARTPAIYLKGNSKMTVELSDSSTAVFEDPGYTAFYSDGTELTASQLKSEVRISGTVNMNEVGTYTIKYSIIEKGISKTVTRKVTVVDKEPPVLVVAEDITIYETVKEFIIMDGVTATDNSGKIANIVASSNITLGVSGEYTINYIASDESGNATTATRKVTIIYPCYTFDEATGTITGFNWSNPTKCTRNLEIPNKINGHYVKAIGPEAIVPDYDYLVVEWERYVPETNENIEFVDIYTPEINYYYANTIINGFVVVGEAKTAYLVKGNPKRTKRCYKTYNTYDEKPISYEISSSDQYIYCAMDDPIDYHVTDSVESVDFTKATELSVIYPMAFVGNYANNNIIFGNDNKLTTIGQVSFAANNLNYISFGNNITSIGDGAFVLNRINTPLDIPDNITEIGYGAFTYNDITSISIGSGLKSIKSYVFRWNLITHITIPSTVEEIGDGVFSYNPIELITVEGKSSVADFKSFKSFSWDSVEVPLTCKVFNESNSTIGCVKWNG